MYKNAKRLTAIFLLVFLLIISINFAVIAQDSSDGPSVNIPPQLCSVPPDLKTQQVIADNGRNQVKMGDRIRVKVKGLSAATTNVSVPNIYLDSCNRTFLCLGSPEKSGNAGI